MVPEEFTVFFAASAGASATLLGLLFVAIAVDPERVFGGEATADRRAVAQAAYTALIDAFFVSLVALIPNTNVGAVALVGAVAGLISTVLSQGGRLWRERRLVRGTTLAIIGLIVYGLQLWYAWALLRDSQEASFVYALVYLLIAVYAVGLALAWELLGARREGIMDRLLAHARREETVKGETAPPEPERTEAGGQDP